jgi:hypothetical protein
MSLQFRNDWEPEFWMPEAIHVSEFYLATTEIPFPLVELDEELFYHPDLDWLYFGDFMLEPGGTLDIYLGIPPYDMYVLAWFYAVHTYEPWFQVHEIWQIPTWPTTDPCPVEQTSWTKIKTMYR